MRRRSLAVVVTGVMALVLLFSQSASAATVVGNHCAGNLRTEEQSVVTLADGSGSPVAMPTDGVVTSWTFTVAPIPAGLLNMQLKIFRPTALPGQVQVVGESLPTPMVGGVNSFPVRIPVKAGDLIGSSGVLESVAASVVCNPGPVGDKVALIAGTPFTGATVPFESEEVGIGNPITATVEPDADGDGFGDETQDKCPTNASTQGPCPAPPPLPAPITLSASGAAKKGLLTITLTSSAQANVTVGGTVKLGKGKSVTLSGGTQVVTPGTLAKFVVLFPAKLTAKLKQLTTKQKLTLSLSATAPGATATSLTVNVKGQKKAAKPRHQKKDRA